MNRVLRGGKTTARFLSLLLILSMLLVAAGPQAALAQPNVITGFSVNGTNYNVSTTEVNLGRVNTLNHTVGLTINRDGSYSNYRATVRYMDGSKGNPVFGKDFSGSSSSLTFDLFSFSSGSASYDIELDVYGTKDGAEELLGSKSFTLVLGVLDTTAPAISSRTPASGATVVDRDTSIEIVFNEELLRSSVDGRAHVTLSPALSGTLSLGSDERTVTFTPSGSLAYGTTYTVTVVAGGIRDLAGNGVAQSQWTFTTQVDPTAAPVIVSRQPAQNATGVPVNTTVTMDFSKPLNTGTVAGNITLRKGTSIVAATVTPLNVGGLGRVVITPTASLENLTQYTVVVEGGKIEDAFGLKVAGTSWNFTTVAGANPVISSRTPDNGARNVPVDTDVRITFSQNMATNTITGSNLYLRRSGSNSNISATLSYNSSTRTVTLKPSSLLSADTDYVVSVTSGVKNTDGLALTATSWTFRTGKSAIAVTNRTPAPDETGVVLNQPVRFRFSGNMNGSTVNTSNIYLRKAGTTRNLDVDFAYNSSNREVTLTPKRDYDLNTRYTVTLTDKVQDANRVAIQPVSWSFTTARTDVLRVVDSTPAEGAENVVVDTDVRIRFTKELRATTVTGSTIYLRQVGSSRNIDADLDYSRTGKTVTLTPKEHLRANTEYRVSITTGLRDSDGSAISATSWVFKTGREKVVIGNRDPALNATEVPVDKAITFRFSRAMSSNTITGTNVTLRLLGSSVNVPAQVTYNASTFTVSLKPTSDLEYGKMYTVQISDRVKDADGAAFSGESWSFVTAVRKIDPIRFGTSTRPLVRLDGAYMTFTDASPYIENGTTMLPYRAIFEALGATVGFDNSNPRRVRITGSLGGNQIVMYIGELTAYRNGQPITLRVAPKIINGRTMVPLRFIGESLGIGVQWDPAHYNVILTTK